MKAILEDDPYDGLTVERKPSHWHDKVYFVEISGTLMRKYRYAERELGRAKCALMTDYYARVNSNAAKLGRDLEKERQELIARGYTGVSSA